MAAQTVEISGRVSVGRLLAAAFAGGLIAGSVDVVNGALIYRASAIQVLQSIARGLVGKSAFHGGLATAALGAALQLFISVVAALIYVAAAGRAPLLLRRPVSVGALYGAGVFLVMNLVVMPLSRTGFVHKPQPQVSLDFAANCLFGVIIAAVASRTLRRPG